MSNKLKHLFKLLDDENQQTASLAMAQLLNYEDRISPALRKLQESGNDRLRKRIHQIQSIITLRRRRKSLSMNLKNKHANLIKALIELHLQWYDNDAEEIIFQYWTELKDNALKNNISTIEKLGLFMQKSGFNAVNKDDVEADYYCIGIVFEDLMGSDFILCSIAREIAAASGLELKIIQLIGDFGLMNQQGQILLPKNGWRIISDMKIKKEHYKEWNASMILNFASSLLFMCAVSMNSFRYINTLGTCMAKSNGKENISFLPYPYNTKK